MKLLGTFVLALLGAPRLVMPLAADAQPTTKIPRIGILAAGTPTTYIARYEAFRQGLRELGYEEGQNIIIDYRYAEGRFERLPDLAAELIRLKVDVIVTAAAPETNAAKHATPSIPIVFAAHGDSVGTGHVASLARPGGNVTGMSVMTPELAAKRLELLKEAFPRIARIAVIWNAANPAKAVDWRETQIAARALGLTLQSDGAGPRLRESARPRRAPVARLAHGRHLCRARGEFAPDDKYVR